eukprot:g3722.t1
MFELTQQVLDMEDGCAYSNATGNACRCEWCSAGAQSLRPWIDEETSRVEISMVVYNAQYGSYTYVSVNFMFNRGGHIHSFIHCLSAFVNPFLRPGPELALTLVAATLWIGALLYALAAELTEIRGAIRNSNAGLRKALWEEHDVLQAILEDVEFINDKLDFFDRLLAPGDAEYDFYFGADGQSHDQASRLWIYNSITAFSEELQQNFVRGIQRIGTWQDEFECEQTELADGLREFEQLLAQSLEALQELSNVVEGMDKEI